MKQIVRALALGIFAAGASAALASYHTPATLPSHQAMIAAFPTPGVGPKASAFPTPGVGPKASAFPTPGVGPKASAFPTPGVGPVK